MSVYNFWYLFYFVFLSGLVYAISQPIRLEQSVYLILFLIYSTVISRENMEIMREKGKYIPPIVVTITTIIPTMIVIILGYLWEEDSYHTNLLIGTVGTLFLGKYVLINSGITSITKKIRWYYPIGYFLLSNSFWELSYLLGWLEMTAPIQVFS